MRGGNLTHARTPKAEILRCPMETFSSNDTWNGSKNSYWHLGPLGDEKPNCGGGMKNGMMLLIPKKGGELEDIKCYLPFGMD